MARTMPVIPDSVFLADITDALRAEGVEESKVGPLAENLMTIARDAGRRMKAERLAAEAGFPIVVNDQMPPDRVAVVDSDGHVLATFRA